jgi:sterol 3beta-glucosyltransferase
MSSQDRLREILGRKLTELRAEPRKTSMELPQHLKDGDDNEEDVLKPKAGSQVGFVNQSILGIISKASTSADFQSRFDESSSDSEDKDEDDEAQKSESVPTPSEVPPDERSQSQESKHVRTSSKSALLRSVGKLRLKSIRERKSVTSAEDLMSSSQILTPRPSDEPTQDPLNPDAPILSRKLRAEADIQSSDDEAIPATTQHPAVALSPKKKPVPLAKRLMEIFDFEEPEQVIAEWKCYLLQSVLLMGYMYVTQRHVCFYAYLPKRAAKVAKSGYFNKRGQHNPRYRRYYFELKGDVLSYYESPASIYYPSGKIDLRYGISANISDHKDGTYFTVVTEKKQYQFRADSAVSAKEWVKHLQRAIFRSHNDGDIVKISIPTENIIDVEDNPIIEFADTVKIRVFDNDETYAIDEYFFSFTSHAQDAIRVLRILVDDKHLNKDSDARASLDLDSDKPEERRSRSSLPLDQPSTVLAGTPLRESVRATLSPSTPASRGISSSRKSIDSQRSSRDISRRSFDEPRTSSEPARRSLSVRARVDRSRSPFSRNQQGSFSSPTTNSPDLETESSAAVQSLDETNVSASQILSRTDLFQRPTMYDSRPSISETSINELRRVSEDTARSDRVARPEHSENEQDRKGPGKHSFEAKARSTNIRHTPVVGESSQGLSPLSLTSIQDLLRAGTIPLQRASGLAGFLRERSKRMSSLVATESMGYYEKVSEMWAGGGRHYSSAEGVAPDDGVHDADDEEDAAMATKRFRDHFALPESEQLIASYYTFFHRVLPLYGKIYVSNKNFCFRSLLPGTRTKVSYFFTILILLN